MDSSNYKGIIPLKRKIEMEEEKEEEENYDEEGKK